MKWEDVTTQQYLEITEIQQREDTEYNKLLDITAVLNNIDVDEITITNFKEYAENIKFISEDIPLVEIKDEYDNYTLHKELSQMSMKQYIDFNNYAKTNDYVGVLSVFLIPKGKQYNEGYDIEEVRQYILTMSCVNMITIYAFFLMQSQIYMEHFQESLKQKQMKILTKKKQERRQKMSKTQIFLLFHRYARSLIYRILKSWKCRILKFCTYLIGLFKRTKKN
jgi:hypothetical protein